MVVVVDVVDAASPTAKRNTGVSPVERLEIDVDVTAQTTADSLLVDVEAALTEMRCVLCVPRAAAALAAGNALPPLAALELAMQSSLACADSSAGTLAAKYVSAVRHVKGSAAAIPRDQLRIGVERVCRAASSAVSSSPLSGHHHHQQQKQPPAPTTVVWSVVPRALGESTESCVTVSASSATSLRMLARDDARIATATTTTTAPAETGSAVFADAAHLTRRLTTDSDVDAVRSARAPAAEDAGRPANASPPTAVEGKEAHDGKRSGTGQLTKAAADAAPPLSPHSPTPVVALEDVDVVAFRRLQAHRALILARAEAASVTSALPGGVSLTTAEEQQRLQPMLPYAAVEAAIQTEVRRLRAEHVLTDGCALTHREAKEAGDLHLSPRGSPSSAPSLSAARARLRRAWLQAVKEETAAYQAETRELQRATVKAETWRAALKDTLRGEVAVLETEAAQRATVLAERDVLRQRVEQLEAQVAAAKAEEMALLQSSTIQPRNQTENSAGAASGAAGSPTRLAAEKQSESAGTNLVGEDEKKLARSASVMPSEKASRRPLRIPSPASSSSFSSSVTSSETSSDADVLSPPPPFAKSAGSAHPFAHRVKGSPATAKSQRPHRERWSGRRVSLISPQTAPAPPRSRDRLSIERSFLSPTLLEEVRAALTSDEEGSEDAETPPPQPSSFTVARRRRYQRKAYSASWDGENNAAAAVTPLRTASSTAYSPSPVVPASHWAERSHHHQQASAVGASRLNHSSPALTGVYDDGQRSTLLHSDVLQRSDLHDRDNSPTRRALGAAAVAELQGVTAALRRHVREPQPDPVEGQRLLQQVRELRREIERSGMEANAIDDEPGEASVEKVATTGGNKERNRQRSGGGGRGSVVFANPEAVPASAPVPRALDRQPFASPSLLYDSRVPSRQRGQYRC